MSPAADNAALPVIRYPPDLSITAYRDIIAAALREHPVVIVCGDTGIQVGPETASWPASSRMV